MTDLSLVISMILESAAIMGHEPVRDIPVIEVATFSEARAVCGPCRAWYKWPVLHLREDIDLSTVYGRAVLVHELEHHRQQMTGRIQRTCASYRANEMEAYKVQSAYIGANGGYSYMLFMAPRCAEK